LTTAWKADGNAKMPWAEMDLHKECTISRAVLFEGEFEAQYSNLRSVRIMGKVNGEWKLVKEVKAWGQGKTFDEWPLSVFHPEIRFPPITTRYIRLEVTRSTGKPIIHELELYER
jgi:alpha-L-fucosidase